VKVVIVAPYFYPRVGGAEVYTINVARQLKAMGWEVVIVTTGERNTSAPESIEGMTVHRLRPLLKISNTPVGLGWRRQLRNIFMAEQPDLINAHTPVPFLADVAQRSSGSIPFVLTYHNDLAKDFLLSRIVVRLAHLTLIRRTLSGSTRIIATSEFYVKESPYLKKHQAKTCIVPPGVDISRFNKRVKVEAELANHFGGHRIILFVGSVSKSHQHKGINILIKTFSKINVDHPDTRLVIVGKGNGVAMYRSLAASSGVADKVEFTGYVDDNTLAQYYRLATVFAMPSTNRSEGFGMVYIEANAVGTPVVGCNVGGVRFAIKDNETGLLAQPNSVESLYHALRRILDDDQLARRLGEAGSERAAREFGWSLIGESTSRVFREVAVSPAVALALKAAGTGQTASAVGSQEPAELSPRQRLRRRYWSEMRRG
jgi:glycosyltransferase involved in cell wall biosynthesis